MTNYLPTSLSFGLKKIIELLESRGAIVEILSDTEVVIVTINKHEYYFIQDRLPVFPQNIALILSDKTMVQDTLNKLFSMNLSSIFSNFPNPPAYGLDIYIDKNGWMQVLSKTVVINYPNKNDKSSWELTNEVSTTIYKLLKPYAENILSIFAPSPYICWELLATPEGYKIGNIFYQIEKFISHNAYRGRESNSQLDVLSNLFNQEV